MSARERILARLRAAPGRNALPLPNVAAHFVQHGRRENEAERLSRFQQVIQTAHAEVIITDQQTWLERLREIAGKKNLHKLLVGEKLPGQLAAGLDILPSLVCYQLPVDTWRNRMFDGIDASLTLARGAIAETGSLILWPDANEPRLMSLVPPVHIVLLDPAYIHADLHTVMACENWSSGLPTNALLVSGPSKTADIQQVLAYGAHGPKELIVLICPGVGRAA